MFRSAYSGYFDKRFRVDISFLDSPSRTEQTHKVDCDINVLLGRYKKTGVLPSNTKLGSFMDVQSMDFQTAMQVVADGSQAFDALPSNIRNKFANDPLRFLDFVHTPGNEAEMIKLGLAVAPPVPLEALAEPSAP